MSLTRQFITNPGNTVAVRTSVTGGRVQASADYYPYGPPFADGQGLASPTDRRLFGDKELIRFNSYNTYDYTARQYPAAAATFDTPDPLCEQFYWMSPYSFCGGNPIARIDPSGMIVKPAGDPELTMIKNTLPPEAQNYVKLDGEGCINKELLNSYTGDDINSDNLKELVNSPLTTEVILDDKYTYSDSDGNIGEYSLSHNLGYLDEPEFWDPDGNTSDCLSTGETGNIGKTLFPDRDGLHNSPTENIIVVVNSKLTPEGAAETYSHEANGHVLLYLRSGGNHLRASHLRQNILELGNIDCNTDLDLMIKNSKRATLNNMKLCKAWRGYF